MTLGDYYRSKKRNISPEKRMREIRMGVQKRLKSAPSVKQCKELQDFLNQVFYPNKYIKSGGKDYSAKISQLITEAYRKKYNDAIIAFDNFSMGSSNVVFSQNNLTKLLRERHESFNHTEKIYIDTINTRLNKVKDALTNVENNADLKKIEEKLKDLETQLKKLLDIKTDKKDKKGAYLDLKNNEGIFSQVQKMDESFKALSQVGGIFTPEDYGYVLEWILQAFSSTGKGSIIDNLTDDVSDELLDELLDKMMKTAGSSRTGKSGSNFITPSMNLLTDVQIVREDKEKKGKTIQEVNYEISDGINSFKFAYTNNFNPDSDRQGKMDVDFTFNDRAGNKVPFRISAKNWQTLDRDFGETPLVYALLRSAGNESTIEYMYAMQDENNQDIKNSAHRLAKYSALVDILMGYSQKNQYADTIVINHRAQQEVIVASISDILNQIKKDLNKLQITGYDDNLLETRMVIIRRAISNKEERSEAFESLALKYLQSVRVQLRYANIANSIRTKKTLPT